MNSIFMAADYLGEINMVQKYNNRKMKKCKSAIMHSIFLAADFLRENVEFTLKFRQSYPPLGRFLSLNDLSMSILCCQWAL